MLNLLCLLVWEPEEKCFGWAEGVRALPVTPSPSQLLIPGLGEGVGNGIRHREGLKTGLQKGDCSKELFTLCTAQIHLCLHVHEAKSLFLGPKSNLINWAKAELIKCRRGKRC